MPLDLIGDTCTILQLDAREVTIQAGGLIHRCAGEVVVDDVFAQDFGDRAAFVKGDVAKLAGMRRCIIDDLSADAVINWSVAAACFRHDQMW